MGDAVRFLRETMNAVHVDTRHYVIRKELLFATGERFDPALLEETGDHSLQRGATGSIDGGTKPAPDLSLKAGDQLLRLGQQGQFLFQPRGIVAFPRDTFEIFKLEYPLGDIV